MKFTYPAVFKKKEDGSFTVHFPDLSLCQAAGKNYEEAMANAKEAERDWIELELQEEEINIPFVSQVEDLPVEEGDIVQLLSVNIRLMEGWDE